MVILTLFLLGIIFIYIGFNSLKQLKENNKKWQEIEQFYIVPNDVYLEFRQEQFEEAKFLVRKFQKYIPILSIMSIACGVLSLLGIFFINHNIHFNLEYLGYVSLILIISSIPLYRLISGDEGLEGFIFMMIWLNTKYKLLINLFSDKEKYFVVKSIHELFLEYIKEKYENIISGPLIPIDGHKTHINGRISALFIFYLGIFLFLTTFIFDNQFYQKVISFF